MLVEAAMIAFGAKMLHEIFTEKSRANAPPPHDPATCPDCEAERANARARAYVRTYYGSYSKDDP